MNRHQRRKAAAHEKKKIVKQLREIHEDGYGLKDIEIATAAAFVAKDAYSEQAIMEFIEKVEQGEQPLCLLCDHSFDSLDQAPPLLFAIVRGHQCATPRAMMASAICEACGLNEKDLPDRVLEAYRKIWPDAERLEYVHPPHRA